jgi:flagellar protein FlaG
MLSSAFGGASQDSPGRKSGRDAQNAGAPEYRLVIEEGARPGTFVYKTVDRSTGETVRQYPREELVRLGDDPSYVAGTVTSTRV